MANHRTAWHVLFVGGLAEHGSPAFDVLSEYILSKEPLRADVVVVRRRGGSDGDSAAGTLRAFWPLVRHTALVEFKSPGRPFRAGELGKLFGYGGQYYALHAAHAPSAEDLLLVLVVPSITPALTAELASLGLRPVAAAPGYLRAECRPFELLVVDLSAVVDADGDELMSIFVRSKMLSLFAIRFMEQHRMTPNAPQNLADLEDYQDVVQRWLSALTPAQRLEGLAPAQRLEGLSPAELLAALPEEVLRGMSDEYLRALPADAQHAVRKRIGRPR